MSELIHKSIQRSIFELLKNDSALSNLVQGVYNTTNEGEIYPYIVIDSLVTRDWSTRTSLGFNTIIPIMVYSQTSSEEALDILDRIYELIVGGNITLMEHQLIALKFDQHSVEKLEDGVTLKGQIRFRAFSEFVPV